MNALKKTTFSFIFLCTISHSPAYNLTQIPNSNNLSNSSITDFCQNEKGFMLIGTCDGLNFYNSRDIVEYLPENGNSFLSGDIIDKIVYTGDNIFWIQTYYGLDRFDANTNSVIHYTDFQKFFFLEKDQSGNLFLLKESNSIYYYHKSSATFKKILISGLIFSDIIKTYIDGDNTLWIITSKGYNLTYKINKDKAKGEIILTSTNNNLLFENKLLYCFFEDNYLYYIDEKHDLYCYELLNDKKTFVYNLRDEIQKRGKVSSIIRHHNDYFIGFITNGLLLLEKKNEPTLGYVKKEIEVNCGVFCLKKDLLQDIVWIGTDGKGVYSYSNSAYSIRSYVLNNLTHKMERPVRAMFLDDNNTLWVGSKGDGILRILNYDINKSIYDSKIEPINTGNSYLNDNVVYVFGKSKKNILWIGSEEGLNYYSYRTKSVKKINVSIDGQTFKYIHDIYETSDSKLWLASVGFGIVCADIVGSDDNPQLTNVRHYTINNDDFESNYFFSMYVENDTLIWFSNRGNGPFRYNPKTDNLDPVNHFSKYTNKTINDVFAMQKDDSGDLLIGTGFGLIKYISSNEHKIFNTSKGFLNNSIHAIEPGDFNTYWLSTNSGIIHFNSQNDVFRIYENADGLKITEFSDGASFKDEKNDILFFGGINGFVAIQKDLGVELEYMPDIFFERLTIFGENYNISDNLVKNKDTKQLELQYEQNFFSLSFIAIDYINGGNYTYYYKIDELSDNWINNGQSNLASFTNISPGNYTLKVKYHNRTLNQESAVYSLQIKILPPWYLSTWAYLVYWLLCIGIFIFIARYITLRQQRKKQLLLAELDKKHQKEVFESKLRFFTNIAHEFCTPLTLISGPCERILSQTGISKFVSNYIKMIQTNAERLNGLILELIEFRRIETGNRELQIESLNITELSENILDTFSDIADSKKIDIEFNAENQLKWNSDKGFITTIILNLVSNAFKYTGIGKKIKVNIEEIDNQLQIIIANEGKPIKEKDFKRIFDRYTVLDSFENKEYSQAFSRNGLGLAILYNMVSLLKGTVEVTNTEDGFVQFTVKLPDNQLGNALSKSQTNMAVYAPKIEKRRTIKLPKYEFDRTKPNMLVIDDDVELLWLIGEMFSDEFNVNTLDEPRQLETILEQMQPDIILSDVMMPHLSGIELTKMIKSKNETCHIPVILISGNYEIEQQIEAIGAGAEMYINKPFDTKYLKISVKQIIERKEKLKDYFNSPISSYELAEGKLTHKEHKKFFQSVLQIITDNITNEELSTKFIADKLGISTRSLYRKMEELGEKSLTNLIRDCRLHVAANLLIKSKFTIEEVSYKSGFANKVTFFKAFNQKYGCTPKNYRIQHEEDLT